MMKEDKEDKEEEEEEEEEEVQHIPLHVDTKNGEKSRTFGRAEFLDTQRFPDHAKYVLKKHVRVTEVGEREYDVDVLKEKVCVWVWCDGIWQKLERTPDAKRRRVRATTQKKMVFSFFAPKGCPDDTKEFRKNRFKIDECIGAWTVCSDARTTSREKKETTTTTKEKKTLQTRQMCLVLTGTSGSGKSTIAKGLCVKKWTVVNQDTIGSYCERECFRKKADQCVMKAKHGLMLGRHVVIDRTNMSAEQRKKFVDAVRYVRLNSGDDNIQLVSLYLDLDKAVTTSRVAQRQNHEGGVEGRKGVGILHKQLYSRDSSTPHKSEGFELCFRCKTQAEVELAVSKIKSMTGHDFPPFPTEWDGIQKPPSSLSLLVQPSSPASRITTDEGNNDKRKKTKYTGFFLDGLLKKQRDPERECTKEELLTINETCFAIKDKYPKAKFHALVLPRSSKFKHPFDVFKEEEGSFENNNNNERQFVWNQMVSTALDIVKDQQRKLPPETKFRVGFHLKPSMQPVHLHVISQDFVSEKLTTKQHWHTFVNNEFFIDFFKAETMTRQWDDSRCEQIVKSNDLRCHKCKSSCTNMPQLKRHIVECVAPQTGYTHDELIRLSSRQQPQRNELLQQIFSKLNSFFNNNNNNNNEDNMDI